MFLKKLVGVIFGLLLVMLMAASCQTGTKDTVTIFHAGSLSVPFAAVADAFEEIHPDIKIETESAGSRTTVRKVTELGKLADIIGSADYVAIEQLMFPEFASWYIIFASNQMVIAYTDGSQYSDEINGDNWYQILRREGVAYGRANPDADPCGYRTVMLWQLAEKYYDVPGLYDRLLAGCPDGSKNMRSKETELIAPLQSGDLDYAFFYRSIAEQHGLKFVELPPQIDLSDVEYTDFYAQASVEVAGREPGTTQTQIGQPILYAVTIPENAPRVDLAVEFLQFLLGLEGQAIMEENGHKLIVPAIANDLPKVPAALRGYIVEK